MPKCLYWKGSYKTWNGTERNGMEPEVIGGQYGHGRRIRDVLICQLIKVQRAHLASCTSHEDGTSRRYRATLSVLNILAVYLVSSSGVADPLLTSEWSAMSLQSLGSAVGSRFTCGSPWNRKGMVSLSVLSTNTKQASPERPLHNIRQAKTGLGSAMRFYQYIYSSVY